MACAHQQTGTCALMLTQEESNRFDLHPAENPLLGFIWQQVVAQNYAEMREVLSGAHVVIKDPQGRIYNFLENLPGAVRRGASTHRSDRAQYDIPEGRVVSSLLIGYLSDATWFQLEASPWDLKNHFWQSLGHIFDVTEYVISFMSNNVGPLGTSRYTDQKPLRKESFALADKVCPVACLEKLPGATLQEQILPSLETGLTSSKLKIHRHLGILSAFHPMSSDLADEENMPVHSHHATRAVYT